MTSPPEQISQADFEAIIGFTVHDAKNALGLMLHATEDLARDLANDPTQRARIASLQYELARVNGALMRLLALHRMRYQQLPLCPDSHPLDELCEDLVARIHSLAELRNTELIVKCPQGLSGIFDDELVAAVVLHALFGALRYGDKTTLLQAEAAEHGVLLRVSDDGPGFSDKQLQMIGSQPGQAHLSSGDTGLGLYFSSRIAAMHQQHGRRGEVRLRNGPPLGGGVFELFLPG